jgi:hypothetical protein
MHLDGLSARETLALIRRPAGRQVELTDRRFDMSIPLQSISNGRQNGGDRLACLAKREAALLQLERQPVAALCWRAFRGSPVSPAALALAGSHPLFSQFPTYSTPQIPGPFLQGEQMFPFEAVWPFGDRQPA